MTYEVTASRRRPQRFDDLAGQEFTAATLKNAIQTRKIAHAYLFSGPRGCGKTSAARILAKALNCEQGPASEPCGVCAACVEITRGASLDVIEIDGASNTGVNDVRQVKDEILFPPNSCRYKIYIIDEVHMLSTSAFNALLKTIEEPPPYVVFIFATTELHKVPATIKSRCQQFNFRLIAVERIKDLLSEAAAEIGIMADDEALFWIARESTGSARDAYTLFDQITAFSENHITYEKIRDKLGLVGVERLNELCEACVDGIAAAALEQIDSMFSAGVSIEQFTADTTDYIRSLLLIQNGICKEALLGQNAARFSQKVLASWNSTHLELALSVFLQLFRDIRYSVDPRFELELAIVRLCSLLSYVSAADVKNAIDQTRSLLLKNVPLPTQNVYTERPQGTLPTEQNTHNQTKPQQSGVPQFKAMQEQRFAPEQQNIPTQQTIQATPLPVQTQPEQPRHEVSQETVSSHLNDVRESAAERIDETSTTLAQALLQTENWKLEGTIIHAEVPSAFLKNQLIQESVTISAIISEIMKKTIQFQVELKTQKKENEQQGPAREVELLCKVFKGTEI